jgi:hypothetical protein
MTTRKYSSRSQQTTLTTALNSSATTMSVTSGSALMGGKTLTGTQTYTVVIDPDTALEEIVDVTVYSSGNTLTITRNIDGSTGQAHSAGAVVRHMAIGRDYQEANDHIEASTNVHGLAVGVAVVGDTTTQTLSGKTLTSPTINSATMVTPSLGVATATSVTASTFAGALTGNVTGNVTGNLNGAVTGNVTGNLTGSVTGNVTGNVSGNASTATALATGRTISLTGDVSGTSGSFDGTGNASITAAIAANTIVDADINASAAIALSKLATDPLPRANHTGTQAASTISDFDTQVRTSRLDQMAAPSAAVSLNSQKITNLDSPTASADAANKGYVDTSISNLIAGAPSTLDTLDEIAAALADTANFSDTVVLKTGSTMSGALAMGTNKITGLGTPTASTDAATKGYIDSASIAPSNLTGPITSVGPATSVAAQTGTGSTFVMDTSPTLVTPVLGVATATSINGTTIPSSKTLVATDSTAFVVPSQTSNSGKYLTTDGTTSSWGTVASYSAPTLGSTSIASGATVTTIAGLTLTSPVINSPKVSTTYSAKTAAYTFASGDEGNLFSMNNASSVQFNIPTDATFNFAVGTEFNVFWITGAGQPTIGATTPGTTTVISTGATSATPKLRVANSGATIKKLAANSWIVFGDLA